MNEKRETIFDIIRRVLDSATILRKEFVKTDSMSYDGRNSIDLGDEIIGTRFGLDDMDAGNFVDRDVFIVKYLGNELLCGISGFNEESVSISIRFFNPDKTAFPDKTLNLGNVESIHKVINIGKFRGFDLDEETP